MKPSVVAAIFTVAYQLFSLYLCRKYRPKLRDLIFGAVACALTAVFSYFVVPLPTGAVAIIGSSIPLILTALVCDFRLAIVSGWVMGILTIVLMLPAWQPVHWAQIFVEHMICFSCLGYAGIFGSDSRRKMWCGIALTLLLQFTSHLLSGAVFFSSNAWGGWSAWGYSLVYNLSQIVTEGIVSIAVISVLPIKNRKLAVSGKK